MLSVLGEASAFRLAHWATRIKILIELEIEVVFVVKQSSTDKIVELNRSKLYFCQCCFVVGKNGCTTAATKHRNPSLCAGKFVQQHKVQTPTI